MITAVSFSGNGTETSSQIAGGTLGNGLRKFKKTVDTVQIGARGLAESTSNCVAATAGAYAVFSAVKGIAAVAKGNKSLGSLLLSPFKAAGSLISTVAKGAVKGLTGGITIKKMALAPFEAVRAFATPAKGSLLGRTGRIVALAIGAAAFSATLFKTRLKINEARHRTDEKMVNNKI